MGFEELISETEACAYAGISIQTLRQFADSGHLQIETDEEGLRLVSKRELGEVFGIANQISEVNQAVNAPLIETASTTTPPPDEADVGPKTTPEFTVVQGKLSETSDDSALAADTVEEAAEQSEKHAAQKNASEKESTLSPAPTAAQKASAETTRLEHELSMSKTLLHSRESEVEALKQERDWLRRRIEHLEQKAERDQMLLLSETQVVRRLISHRSEQRSPWRLALEWLGFQSESQKETIEVQRSSTEKTQSS